MLRRFFGAIRTYYINVLAMNAPEPVEINSTRLLRHRRHQARIERAMLVY